MIGTPAACIAWRAARLRAHQLDRGRRRADPDEARRLDRARERGVLGEEAVAGMDRLGARAGSRRRAASRRPGSSRPRCCRRGRAPRRRRARGARAGRRRSRRRPTRCPGRAACGRCGERSLRDSRPGLWRTHSVFSLRMSFADQLTVARAARGAGRHRPVRDPVPRARLLGDGRVLRRDGDRLVRRPDRAAERAHVVARLAARPGGRQAPRDGDADRADRPGRLPGVDGRRDRRARAARSRACGRRRSSAAS